MPELFPELQNLKGGPKQAWIKAHLTMIWDLTEEVGFDKAALLFHMKATTLVSALQRAEKGSFPAVTNGKRAMAKSQYVENLTYDLEKRFNTLQDQFKRTQQAQMAALELIERVLLMLRLSLTGEKPLSMGKADFEAGAAGLDVTSSNEQSAPLKTLKPPTGVTGLLEQAKGKGASVSKGRKRDTLDTKKSSRKTK